MKDIAPSNAVRRGSAKLTSVLTLKGVRTV
jgi:hypothetical protein